jgi:protein-disulfide isomerase
VTLMCSEQRSHNGWMILVQAVMTVLLPFTIVCDVYADVGEASPVVVFLSPMCGKSRDKLVELIPHVKRIRENGGAVSFRIVLLSGRPNEFELAQRLLCASEQGTFEPFFLYSSQATLRRQPLALNTLLSALAMDPKQFRRCMDDIDRAEFTLEQTEALFLHVGLTGVPSVMVGGRAFSLTDADSIIDVLRRERKSQENTNSGL